MMLPEDTVLVVVDMQDIFLGRTTETLTSCEGGLNEGVSDDTPLLERFVNRGCLNAINRIIEDSHELGGKPIFLVYSGEGDVSKKVSYRKGDTVINKPMDDGFYRTNLEDCILSSGTKNVVFVGATSKSCVKKTVLSALKNLKPKELEVYVAQNAVLSADKYQKASNIRTMNRLSHN